MPDRSPPTRQNPLATRLDHTSGRVEDGRGSLGPMPARIRSARPCSRRACGRNSRSDWRPRRCHRDGAPSTARSRRHSRCGHRSWCRPRDNPLRMPYRSANHCRASSFLGLAVRLRRGRIAVRIGVGRGEYSWAVSLIMCTGGEYRGVLHDRHFSAT
jgi:hypothetical protein